MGLHCVSQQCSHHPEVYMSACILHRQVPQIYALPASPMPCMSHMGCRLHNKRPGKALMSAWLRLYDHAGHLVAEHAGKQCDLHSQVPPGMRPPSQSRSPNCPGVGVPVALYCVQAGALQGNLQAD